MMASEDEIRAALNALATASLWAASHRSYAEIGISNADAPGRDELRDAVTLVLARVDALAAAPALRERVAALEGALAEIDRLEETYNGRGALHHKWLVREIVKRAAAALPPADGAGRGGE
jgi:hypothetical protein